MSKSNEKSSKKFVKYRLIKDVFLYRNLNFNKPSKIKLNEYYIHTMSKNSSIKYMIKFIKQFQQSRNNKDDTNDLQIINLTNYNSINFSLDLDYYSDCNACLICGRILHNLGTLILHYKLIHLDYQIFHIVRPYLISRKARIPSQI